MKRTFRFLGIEGTLSLDRSDEVLEVHMSEMTPEDSNLSLPQFAEKHAQQLAKTGLCRVTIKAKLPDGVVNSPTAAQTAPRVIAQLPTEPAECATAITALCKPSQAVNVYKYKFQQKQEGSIPVSGAKDTADSLQAYRIKYSKAMNLHSVSSIVEKILTSRTAFYGKLGGAAVHDEEVYWRCVAEAAASLELAEYAADIDMSVLGNMEFPPGWNLARWTEDTEMLRAFMPTLGFSEISGVTTPYLYLGSPGSSFMLHAEDQNLSSCNYLLLGAPKIWYAVPPAFYDRVVTLISTIFPRDKLVKTCPQAVMHKQFLLTPSLLHEHGIPTSRVVQYPGDMMITAPGAFHFGYNCGLNLAEATNFITPTWWRGGHFHDALSNGTCECAENRRFRFDDDRLREAIALSGFAFGMGPDDL